MKKRHNQPAGHSPSKGDGAAQVDHTKRSPAATRGFRLSPTGRKKRCGTCRFWHKFDGSTNGDGYAMRCPLSLGEAIVGRGVDDGCRFHQARKRNARNRR